MSSRTCSATRRSATRGCLRGVDLDVRAGEIVALLGSNGAGKTTLNNLVCGIHLAWSGSVRFDGHDLTRAHYCKVVQAGLIQVPEGRKIFPRNPAHSQR